MYHPVLEHIANRSVMRRLSGTIPSHLHGRVDRLRALEEALADCLPADCCAHVRVADLSAGTLVLIADSPAWRTRLHFYSDRIIRHFNRLNNISVDTLKLRTGHPPPAPRAARHRTGPPAMSAEAGRALRGLAAETDDRRLRDALLRLARHADESTNGNKGTTKGVDSPGSGNLTGG